METHKFKNTNLTGKKTQIQIHQLEAKTRTPVRAKQTQIQERELKDKKRCSPIVAREEESGGRTPEDEGAGEEFPDLVSGGSLCSSLWLLSCFGGPGNCLVRPNSTSATSISSWMKDEDFDIFGGGGCGGVVEGAGDGDGRCFGDGPVPTLLPVLPSGF